MPKLLYLKAPESLMNAVVVFFMCTGVDKNPCKSSKVGTYTPQSVSLSIETLAYHQCSSQKKHELGIVQVRPVV